MKKPEAYKCWEGAWDGKMLEFHELTTRAQEAAKDLPLGCSNTYESVYPNENGECIGVVQRIGDGDSYAPILPTLPSSLIPA